MGGAENIGIGLPLNAYVIGINTVTAQQHWIFKPGYRLPDGKFLKGGIERVRRF
jgi:hypothetical protein